MPFTLPPISRRRFLAGSAALGSSLLVGRDLLAQDPAPAVATDVDRVALLSDAHIGANRTDTSRGVNMFENLTKVVGEVVALDPKPIHVMLNGDCAWVDVQPVDYALALETLQPLREGGAPITMTLGNHDNRERFWQAINARPDEPRPVEARHISIVPMERVNWILLDSLDRTNSAPGVLGPAQLEWLGKALDERADKPVLVMVHHNADFSPRPSALTDTAALMDVLRPRLHVKALIYGHSHVWRNEVRDGIHLVNLPATSYVFSAGQPTGWVDVHLKEEGATFQLKCVDPMHPNHNQTLDFAWRKDEKTAHRAARRSPLAIV